MLGPLHDVLEELLFGDVEVVEAEQGLHGVVVDVQESALLQGGLELVPQHLQAPLFERSRIEEERVLEELPHIGRGDGAEAEVALAPLLQLHHAVLVGCEIRLEGHIHAPQDALTRVQEPWEKTHTVMFSGLLGPNIKVTTLRES